ncbi:MAG TPA: BA14K family protein [Pseudolabrys sp.]|nr:BA14K family protein [Pseudolabrys sp.]
MRDTEAGLRAAAPVALAPVQVLPPAFTTPAAPIAPVLPPAPGATPDVASPGAEVPAVAESRPPIAATERQPRCNVDACAAAYISFRSADCTYQPLNGPRRICTKQSVQ